MFFKRYILREFLIAYFRHAVNLNLSAIFLMFKCLVIIVYFLTILAILVTAFKLEIMKFFLLNLSNFVFYIVWMALRAFLAADF